MNRAHLGDLLWEFEGRIGRSQFWIGQAVVLGIGLGYGLVVAIMAGLGFTTLSVIAWVVLFPTVAWMGLAVSVKRWHDRNKSAWWLLITLVQVIGLIWALIETGAMPGTSGPNRYGNDYWNQYGRKPVGETSAPAPTQTA